MSDWTGVYSTSESIKAGLDLEMPYESLHQLLSTRLMISIEVLLLCAEERSKGPWLLRRSSSGT